MNLYPKLPPASYRLTDVHAWVEEVNAARLNDVRDFENLNQGFVMGRNRTLRNDRNVPTSSTDVVATDIVGDLMVDTNYLYILVDNSGTPVWRRCALSSW